MSRPNLGTFHIDNSKRNGKKRQGEHGGAEERRNQDWKTKRL